MNFFTTERNPVFCNIILVQVKEKVILMCNDLHKLPNIIQPIFEIFTIVGIYRGLCYS